MTSKFIFCFKKVNIIIRHTTKIENREEEEEEEVIIIIIIIIIIMYIQLKI